MDTEIQKLKLSRLLEKLDTTAGDGTSMISLYIRSGGCISQTKKMLTDEYGTAACIKSRV